MNLDWWLRFSLWVTAPANLIVGAAFIFPESTLGLLLQFPVTTEPFYSYLCGGLVILFGGVYFWLATQPNINLGVLGVGALGKLIAVATALITWWSGTLPGITAVLISGDLLFATFWLYYIRSYTRGR